MREMREHGVTRWGYNSQPRWFTLKSFTLGLLTLQSNTPACLTKRSTVEPLLSVLK